MKLSQYITFLSLGFLSSASAQWKTETFTLKGGWNAIFLHGDADHQSISDMFLTGDSANITDVWRWNANPDGAQFTTSNQIPSTNGSDWNVWKRGIDGSTVPSSFNLLRGQTAYLFYCSGTIGDSYSVPITYKPTAPTQAWAKAGANLIGFPVSRTSAPAINTFLSAFPAALNGNSNIYQYIGGEIGLGNPVWTPGAFGMERGKAYWFESSVVGTYHGPLDVELVGGDSIDFGATRTLQTIRLKNQTDNAMNVTLEPSSSEAAPAGQPAIAGDVPMTLRSLNPITLQYETAPLSSATVVQVGANSSVEVSVGVDRGVAPMASGAVSDLFASILTIKDDLGVAEIEVGVTAKPASLTGLWLGEATVTGVSSVLTNGGNGTDVPTSMKLRLIVHQDDTGVAKLLSQVFLGALNFPTKPEGITLSETALHPDEKGTAQRYTTAHLPTNVVEGSSGGIAIPGDLNRLVTIGYDNPTNPFIHQYHPDHDNLDARFGSLSVNIDPNDGTTELGTSEAPTIRRDCTLSFTSAHPLGESLPASWGVNTIGGNYSEVISGLHKDDLTITGTFQLQRISEIGELN